MVELSVTMADQNTGALEPGGRKRRGQRSAVFTSNPEVHAPSLTCPKCDGPLTYRETVFSGVKPAERWDFLDCHTCGPFVYRERTRALRPAI
jgi:transcription elongation factor Elf1